VTLFTVIVLGLSIHITVETEKIGFYFVFAAMAIATSLLTLFTLPTILIIDQKRKGAVTSQIMFEVAWLGTLAIFWMATAGLTSNAYLDAFYVCFWGYNDTFSGCRETQAVEAFAHLNWLWLTSYVFTILAFAVISHNNGRDVWRTSVRDGQFATTRLAQQQPVYYETDPSKIAVQQAYPPQQGYISPQPTGYGTPQPGYPQASPYQGQVPVPGTPQMVPHQQV